MQIKPQDPDGAPNPIDMVGWVGQYIMDKRPDVIVNLGDFWDLPSLSSYDRGKIQFEGRRYKKDVEAGNKAWDLLEGPLVRHQKSQVRHGRANIYTPRKVYLRGNHEYRIHRLIEEDGRLEGAVGYQDLNTTDWEVYDFLEPVFIDGIGYAHFWANPMTGKPIGGIASTRLKTIGHSFTMGHAQLLDYALRFVAGKSQHGLVAGAAYLGDEDYKGYQGNAHWRGIVMKHEVADGSYDPMFVSLGYLCRRYEGMDINDFMMTKYGMKYSG